jgi:hypothetical protein
MSIAPIEEHHEPDATLVDVHGARQPRVDAPCPPEGRENEHAAEDPAPGRVAREQARNLGHCEDECQVEEELDRGDLVLAVVLELALGVGHVRTLARRRADKWPFRLRPECAPIGWQGVYRR